MATVDDTGIAIADEYAEAVLALAEEKGVAGEFLSELGDFVAYMDSDTAFGEFMTSPVIDDDVRAGVLERTLRDRMSDLLLNTILVLNSKGRSALVPLFHERYRLALSRKHNQVDVLVTTAHPLTDDLRARLNRTLADRIGRTPVLIERVDASVIAGLKVQVDDDLMDGSAAGHLRRMSQAFMERETHELHSRRQPFFET